MGNIRADLPTTLHTRVKIKAARLGIKMPQAIIAALRDWVRNGSKKP